MSSVILGFCIGLSCAIAFAVSGVPLALASATYVIVGAAVPLLVLLMEPFGRPIARQNR